MSFTWKNLFVNVPVRLDIQHERFSGAENEMLASSSPSTFLRTTLVLTMVRLLIPCSSSVMKSSS